MRDLHAFAPVLPLLRDGERGDPASAPRDELGGLGLFVRALEGALRQQQQAPTRKQMAPTNVPRFVRARLRSWPLEVT